MTTIRWQRLEGLLVLIAASLWLWSHAPDWPLWFWVIAAIVPDLSLAGYFLGRRAGALLYNAAHLYAGGILLAGIGHAFNLPLAITDVGLLWVCHVGLNRALGCGLKEVTAFTDTHLGRIGRT